MFAHICSGALDVSLADIFNRSEKYDVILYMWVVRKGKRFIVFMLEVVPWNIAGCRDEKDHKMAGPVNELIIKWRSLNINRISMGIFCHRFLIWKLNLTA